MTKKILKGKITSAINKKTVVVELLENTVTLFMEK